MNQLAKELFDYLYFREKPLKADVIIGFGHFDYKISEQCAKLYLQGFASKIIFTGGVGAGSAGLDKPEAEEFLIYVTNRYPQIPVNDILIENKSTNTGDNIRFTSEILYNNYPGFQFGHGIESALIIANAYSQRRVWLTCKYILPDLLFINCPPETDFEKELKLFADKGENFISHIKGEYLRLATYPKKGFIANDETPKDILQKANELNLLFH